MCAYIPNTSEEWLSECEWGILGRGREGRTLNTVKLHCFDRSLCLSCFCVHYQDHKTGISKLDMREGMGMGMGRTLWIFDTRFLSSSSYE